MNQKPVSIEKTPDLKPAQDYFRLRKEGIGFIEQMGSGQWTDYNTHDPGITILEALCYAITDLAYRTGMDIKDILTPESIREMTRVDPRKLDPLGWRSTNDRGEWWRTGTLPGTSALVKRQPNGYSWVILSNTSNYKGPRLAIEMDRIMSHILLKADHWPDYDLFSYMDN